METAKVDIRKLQLLNDRINQCIDALSQVRLSVHGLANVANPAFGVGVGGYGQIPVGLSHTGSFGSPFISPGVGGFMNPTIHPAFGVNPFGQVPIGPNPFFQPLTPGLSHTAGAWALTPFTQGVNPYAGLAPFGSEGLEGYARTGATDPLLTARIAQTFPYAQFPAPPVISIY
ncbi:MAG TPA: hypothetical protein VGL03_16305 [Thermoanaerobaculia bacterium]|jgi:hypothetical protein